MTRKRPAPQFSDPTGTPTPETTDRHFGARALIRRRLFAGVATLVPIVVTVWILKILSDLILSLFEPVTVAFWRSVGFDHETRAVVKLVLSWLLAFFVLYMVGLFSAIVVFRRVITLGERLLERIPIIKSIYGTMKQIVETFSLQQERAFQKVAIIEYPRRNAYVVAFVTGETRLAGDPTLYVNLFVPTTPNPTSGFLLVLPSHDVREADLTIERAFKFIISGGILTLNNLSVRPYQSQAADVTQAAEAQGVVTEEPVDPYTPDR